MQIRMTQEEVDILDDCVKRSATTRTEVVNKGILLVKRELDDEE